MNPFDPKAMIDAWAANTDAFLKAQAQAGQAMMDGLKTMAGGTMPGLPADMSAFGTDLNRANQSLADLWSAAGSLFTRLAKHLPADCGTDTTLANILHPSRWMAGSGEMDDVLGRMAEGPRLADLWDLERRYARVAKAWAEVRQRGLEHNMVVLQAWLAAGRAFGEELAGHAGVEGKALDSKAALALWTDIANRRLLETQRSETFLGTQAANIRATTELRLAQQDLVEHFGKQYGFPTRTELDDLHRTVTELRREMRAMRRELGRRTTLEPADAGH